MATPHLTFFCELDNPALNDLFTPQVISDLQALQAGVSLALRDLNPSRAEVVRRLNQAGIPVTAWLLLPHAQGYWFNLDNALPAADSYRAFKTWTEEFGLQWAGIGIDLEPNIQDLETWVQNKVRLLPLAFARMMALRRFYLGRRAYNRLVREMRADGFRVESYVFPFMDDERKAHSTLIQRVTGIPDLKVDREVWMIYTSQFRPNGIGLLGSYAPAAQAIALGSTGGGTSTGVVDEHPLAWDELSRDLRLAWHWCDSLYVFSLEGCVAQGFLSRLKTFEWDQPILLPEKSTEIVEGWRVGLQSLLWLSANARTIILSAIAGILITRQVQHYLDKRKQIKG